MDLQKEPSRAAFTLESAFAQLKKRRSIMFHYIFTLCLAILITTDLLISMHNFSVLLKAIQYI